MKPIKGFEAKKRGGYPVLPPKGAYVAEIKQATHVSGENGYSDRIECMVEITEGEYAGRYTEVWNDQKERFGDNVQFKGIFRLYIPNEGDENYDGAMNRLQGNLYCIQESNPGYVWDWDEKKLKGKKVGINLRKYLYTYNGQDRETTEIGQFETVEDVRNGKCKELRDRDKRKKQEEDSTDGSEFTDVSKNVDVPWA